MTPFTPTVLAEESGAGPTSPPETPRTGSPTFNRGAGLHNGRRPLQQPKPRSKSYSQPKGMRPGIHRPHIPPLESVGGGPFTYPRAPRPEEISPRSSSTSEDEDSDTSISPPQSPLSDADEAHDVFPIHQPAHVVPPPHTATHVMIPEPSFTIEEYADDMDADCEYLNVLRPSGFEYPESERSRSRSRPRGPDMDSDLMADFQHLRCFESDQSDLDEYDETNEIMEAIRRQRSERRVRRMTSGSISKRTISERGSDSDREDLQPYDTGEEAGRRIRRKVDRRSLLSIPPDVIIELQEPNSDDEQDAESLARELPFFTMEIDSE